MKWLSTSPRWCGWQPLVNTYIIWHCYSHSNLVKWHMCMPIVVGSLLSKPSSQNLIVLEVFIYLYVYMYICIHTCTYLFWQYTNNTHHPKHYKHMAQWAGTGGYICMYVLIHLHLYIYIYIHSKTQTKTYYLTIYDAFPKSINQKSFWPGWLGWE